MKKQDNAVKNNCYNKCFLCKQEGLYSKYSRLTICNKCVNNNNKIKIKTMNESILKNKREYKEDSCLNCNNRFVYRYKGSPLSLCKCCEQMYKIMKCALCPNEYIDDINSLDIFCNVCDEKSKECLDCHYRFISENINEIRCHTCQHRFSYNLTLIFCQECDKEVEIKKDDTWRKLCNVCYKNNLTYFNCIMCDVQFKRLACDTWRKYCSKACNYRAK